MRALVWLVARSARNRFAQRLRRARQPRYALALIAGAAYLWLVFASPGRRAPLAGASMNGLAHLSYALGLAVLVGSWWLLGSERPPLAFTAAEVQLLFPAPLSRRQLVQLKLLQAQGAVLVSTVIWLFLLGAGGVAAPLRAVALWVVFTTLHLHHAGASLVRAGAAEHGAAGLRRGAWPMALFVAAALVGGIGIFREMPAIRAALDAGGITAAARAVLRAPTVMLVLAPFRALLAPVFARSASEWSRTMIPALLLLVVHYPWVLRTDVAFEEGAAEWAARRAAAQAAGGTARRTARGARPGAPRWRAASARLPLAPSGTPAMAIVWKNILAFLRTVRLSSIVIIAIAGTAGFAISASRSAGARGGAWFIGTIALSFAAALVILGPLWIRNDLRLDMLRLEALRAYPLRGASMVRAEVAGSAITLTLIQMSLALVAAIAFPASDVPAFARSARAALALAALLALPAVNGAGLLVQNSAALLFPAWVRLGLTRPRGIEAMGQGILTTFGSLVGLVLLLLVPAAVGIAAAYALFPSIGAWALPPACAAGALLLLGEMWAITIWLGRVFDRTEPLGAEATAEA
ncbi:MAG TPA: hypothetical protein VF041_13820 [Gemmatimonadaceae bacterium]